MKSLILQSKNPYLNLATEDFLLHKRNEDFLVISINDPSVIVGKHQVTNREVNTSFTDRVGIPVIRRISGGGAVYHDHGNLNFAFIRQSEKGKQVDFPYYIKPVTDFLGSLGINALFSGKNDITVNGLKISGNAEHVFRERVLHHGTLLYEASIENMRNALKPANGNYSSRGVESNRTNVTNLKGMGKVPETIGKLASCMIDYFCSAMGDIQPFTPEKEEEQEIRSIAESKYMTWEWNYGYGPPYTFATGFRTSGKEYSCRFLVRDGIIWESDITGGEEITAAGKKLIGCRHMHSDILRVFRSENIAFSDDDIYNFL